MLGEAAAVGNLEVQVHALDALAVWEAGDGAGARAERLLEEADGLASEAGHLVDHDDRLDMARARLLLGGPVG